MRGGLGLPGASESCQKIAERWRGEGICRELPKNDGNGGRGGPFASSLELSENGRNGEGERVYVHLCVFVCVHVCVCVCVWVQVCVRVRVFIFV